MRDHAMPPGLKPTVFVMNNTIKLPTAAQRASCVACVTADDFRWEKAHIKSTSLLDAVFSRQIGVDAGAVETIMFRGDYLSEAASSNVWIIKNGTVMGPPKDSLVLEGVRYGLIEEMCLACGVAFERAASPAPKYWQPMKFCCRQPPKRYCPSRCLMTMPSTTDWKKASLALFTKACMPRISW